MKLNKLSLCLMVLLILFVSGCMPGKKLPPKVEGNLKILLTNMSPSAFNLDYKNDFLAAYPDIKVHIFTPDYPPTRSRSTSYLAIKKVIENENPDLVIDGADYFRLLLADNYLMPLDDLIRVNGFPLDDLHAGVIANLRNKSDDGLLYGLGPTFTSTGLMINRSIFQEKNVALPSEQLTWFEVLDLAEALYDDNRPALDLRGHLLSLVYNIESSNGLDRWDKSGEIVTLENEDRRQIWERVIGLYIRGVIGSGEGKDLFAEGLVAMKLMGSTESALLGKRIDWDVVGYPTGSAGSGYQHANLELGIFANAQNTETAWAFLEYLHRDEYAKRVNIGAGVFPTRISSINYSGDKNLRAFYEPGSTSFSAGRSQIPLFPVEESVWVEDKYMDSFYGAIATEFDAALRDEKSVVQALIDAQLNAQKVLDEAHEVANSMVMTSEKVK